MIPDLRHHVYSARTHLPPTPFIIIKLLFSKTFSGVKVIVPERVLKSLVASNALLIASGSVLPALLIASARRCAPS